MGWLSRSVLFLQACCPLVSFLPSSSGFSSVLSLTARCSQAISMLSAVTFALSSFASLLFCFLLPYASPPPPSSPLSFSGSTLLLSELNLFKNLASLLSLANYASALFSSVSFTALPFCCSALLLFCCSALICQLLFRFLFWLSPFSRLQLNLFKNLESLLLIDCTITKLPTLKLPWLLTLDVSDNLIEEPSDVLDMIANSIKLQKLQIANNPVSKQSDWEDGLPPISDELWSVSDWVLTNWQPCANSIE